MDDLKTRHIQLISIASALTKPQNEMSITILDIIDDSKNVKKRCWCLISTHEFVISRGIFQNGITTYNTHFPELVFVEPIIPRVVRQLYGVMIARDSYYKSDCNGVYDLCGPMLYSANSDIIRCGYNPPTTGAQQLTDWTHFEWIFKTLLLPHNRPFALAVAYGIRWRRLATKRVESRRRALERMSAIKQELVAAAWHPRRMVDWCLDTDEQEELRDLRSNSA
jgi:hypothetical protein